MKKEEPFSQHHRTVCTARHLFVRNHAPETTNMACPLNESFSTRLYLPKPILRYVAGAYVTVFSHILLSPRFGSCALIGDAADERL